MRHRKRGRKLNRNGAHRKALKRNLAASLIEYESIHTTPQKAKFVQPFIEKLITLAKAVPQTEDMDQKAKAKALHNRRRAIALLYDTLVSDPDNEGFQKGVVNKLFENVAPRYQNRPGGYTRILRLPKNRLGDNAEQCLFEFVEGEEVETTPSEAKKGFQHKARRKEIKKSKKAESFKGPTAPKEDPASDQEGDKSSDE